MLSRFLYKWKKSPLPLIFFIPHPLYFFLPETSTVFFSLTHMIPQVKILDYVTIQKQGPYLQQLHITSLSLFMYTGAIRLIRLRMTGCVCYRLLSHDVFVFGMRDTKWKAHRRVRKSVFIVMFWGSKCFRVFYKPELSSFPQGFGLGQWNVSFQSF